MILLSRVVVFRGGSAVSEPVALGRDESEVRQKAQEDLTLISTIMCARIIGAAGQQATVKDVLELLGIDGIDYRFGTIADVSAVQLVAANELPKAPPGIIRQ